MRKILLAALALLSGCASDDILLRPLPAASEPSAEVTVIRPRATVLAEWPVYIVVADQPVFDLRNGEHTRFRVSSGRAPLAIRCLGGVVSKPVETRIDRDFRPGESAYFVVEPKSDCVAARPVSASDAAADLRTTRFRAVGTVDRMAQATGDAPAVFTSKPAAPLPPGDAPASAAPASGNQGVAAATAAWVEAVDSRDVARIASLYDSDAVLRDSSGQRLAAGPGAIAGYLRSATIPPPGEQEIRVFGDTAVASSKSHNIVYRNRGGKWLIVDHNVTAPK